MIVLLITKYKATTKSLVASHGGTVIPWKLREVAGINFSACRWNAKPSLVSIAQMVEHLTFNQGVMGSNPIRHIIIIYIMS